MENKTTATPAPEAVPVVRNPGICLSMPVYGKIDVPFVRCLMALFGTSTTVQIPDFLIGDSLVNRARNNLADRFLAGFPGHDDQGNKILVKHDWQLWLDTDLEFQPADVEKLYQLGLKRGPGIYCGSYPIKQLKPKIVFNNIAGATPDAEGIVEVREAGTGFMLIHREVYEKMIEKFGEQIKFQVDMGDVPGEAPTKYDFYTVGVYDDKELKRRRFLSEDWFFCQRWRECGGKVFMHSRISCNHLGTYSFPGNPQEIIAAADFIKAGLERMKAQQKPLVVKVGPPETFKPKEGAVAVAV